MTVIGYENFDLRIQRAAAGYAVGVDSPAGQARGAFVAITEPELDEFLRGAGALLGARELILPERRNGASSEAFRAFGEDLFERVFSGEVRDRLERSLGLLQATGKRLRIRLRLDQAPELAGLPWEYLYHHDFLSLSTETVIVRYLEVPQPIKPLAVKPPLKILVVISSPTDYPALEVDREWEQLEAALSDLGRRGLVTLKRLPRATVDALQQELPRDEYHIFHFIGHGDFDLGTRAGTLLFEDDEGRGRKVSSQVLKIFLHDESTLRLALLNACKGARSAQQDPFVGTAQSLVAAGVPAVVAMQFAVSDEAAITFAGSFYRALADNLPIDTALAEARKAVFAAQEQSGSIEWGTPVLFLRAEEGTVLDIAYAEALGGLGALTDLLQVSPEVAAAASRYRNDFTTARKDIDSLGDYKDLHDQLHQLHYHCYSLIVGKLRSLTAAPAGALPEEWQGDDALLETNEMTLLSIVDAIRAITARPSFPTFDTSWLPYLEQAHAALVEAIRTLDLGSLKRVRSYLERVLNIQPAKINAELEFTARQLDLPRVVADMTELRDLLAGLKLDAQTVTRFAGGVDALARLDERLAQLLSQHVAWQTIDTYLRAMIDGGVAARLEHEPELFVEDWRELVRNRAEALALERSDGLSDKLREYAARIDEVLAAPRAAELERYLGLYRRCVGLVFYRVDADLKLTCDELRMVGEPLDAVLASLGAVA